MPGGRPRALSLPGSPPGFAPVGFRNALPGVLAALSGAVRTGATRRAPRILRQARCRLRRRAAPATEEAACGNTTQPFLRRRDGAAASHSWRVAARFSERAPCASACLRRVRGQLTLTAAAPLTRPRLRPQIRRDDPLNLSILLSGGKETNKDSLSSGERRGKSPAPNPRPTGGRGKCGVKKTARPASLGGLSPSDRGSARGRCEAGNGPRGAGVRSSRSRVVWECSPKWVVNSI